MKFQSVGVSLVTIILMLAVPVIELGAQPTAPKTHTDVEAFQGAWVVASGGRLKGATIVFSKDELRIRFPDAREEQQGTFKLQPTKNPKRIDILMKGGELNIGIYILSGNTLRVFAVPGAARPKDIPEKHPALLILKRKNS